MDKTTDDLCRIHIQKSMQIQFIILQWPQSFASFVNDAQKSGTDDGFDERFTWI